MHSAAAGFFRFAPEKNPYAIERYQREVRQSRGEHRVMNTVPRSSLMHRYLDPASSLGEVIFGLIMTLTFTLGAGIIIDEEGREGAHELLIALIGCNIAWGVIDGAMYLVGQWFDRGRKRRVGTAVRGAPDEAAATAIIEGELDTWFDDVMTVPERQA